MGMHDLNFVNNCFFILYILFPLVTTSLGPLITIIPKQYKSLYNHCYPPDKQHSPCHIVGTQESINISIYQSMYLSSIHLQLFYNN